MKTYSKLWMLQGSLEEMVKQLRNAKEDENWDTVEFIAQYFENKLQSIDDIATECYNENF